MDSGSLTSIRRSRLLLGVGIAAGIFYFFGAPWTWSMSTSLNESGHLSSRWPGSGLNGKGAAADEPVEEIYGLLHLVTRPDQLQLRDDLDIDLTKPLNMAHYSAGNAVVWSQEKKRFDQESPVVIFSKTYCPYSKRAKTLIEEYDLSPKPQIVEVDLRSDNHLIKQLLTRLTSRGTFPNVVVRGKSIGGSDDIAALHAEGNLKSVFAAAGISVRGKV